MDKIKEILSPIKFELEIFEKKLRDTVSQNDNFLKDYLCDFIFSNPKRLRPAFIFLFSKIFDINSESVFNVALATELIHSASLLHDDIIDEEEQRRNKPTFYREFGSKLAVLEGDLLLSMALKVLSITNPQIIKIFSTKIQRTILGELKQNSSLNKFQSEDEYIKRSYEKTGNLFMAGLEALFTLKNVETDIQKKIKEFLEKYTIAFQLKNDIDNIKYKNSSDILKGNYTLPVIYFNINNNKEDFNLKDFEEKKEEYIAKSIDKIEKIKIEALSKLEQQENSKYTDALKKLVDYTLRSQF